MALLRLGKILLRGLRFSPALYGDLGRNYMKGEEK